MSVIGLLGKSFAPWALTIAGASMPEAAALEDKEVIATLEKYDMAPRYMPAAAYDKFARQLYLEEKAGLEKLGLAAKS